MNAIHIGPWNKSFFESIDLPGVTVQRLQMEHDEKIDYTNYLREKPKETDPERIRAMNDAIATALLICGIGGRASCEYYKDGRVKVNVNGRFYGVFDYNTRKFFSGHVGD